MKEISVKKAALMLASCVLMILSNMVDNKLSEDDIRAVVRSELSEERKIQGA